MKTEFTPLSVDELRATSKIIRCKIIEMVAEAQAGHIGGSLSAADIVTALYFRILEIDPQNPQWSDRDRFVLSKGHACPVWYAALGERGYFDQAHLKILRKLNSILQGHADMNKTPGIDMTVGSLGQGISAGLGMALSGKMREKNYHVWVVVGDGECQEGSVWEAAMAGAKWKLDNLTVIVDKNRLQNDSYTDDIMPLGSLVEKWKSFGWNVLEIDGNDMQVIVETFDAIKSIKNIPTAVIAHTIKGKGVSFMENTPKWHSTAPDQEEAAMAIHEIMGAA